MDNELQRQIEEARANGYSEEQIQAFLNPQPVKETALPPTAGPAKPSESPYVDRTEENIALAQGIGLEAAKYTALGGAGKVAVDTALKIAGRQPTPSIMRGIGNVARGAYNMVRPGVPGIPTVPPSEPLTDFVQQRGAYAPQPQQPPIGGPAAQQATTFIQRMQALATQYAPAARALTGAGAMLYSPSLNTNEAEELRRIRGY